MLPCHQVLWSITRGEAELKDASSHSSNAIKLSAILPVFNGEPYLSEQLSALESQDCPAQWEVVVVDNASTDATRAIALRYCSRLSNFTLISATRRGKAFALNAGRDVARGEYLVTIDADDVVWPGYLAGMLDALSSYDLVCARADFGRLNPPWAVHDVLENDQLTTFLDYLPYVPGGLLGVRASTWDELGGFDTSFTPGDDVDFSWRAYLEGVTIGMAHGATQSVRRPQRPRDDFLKARSYGQAHARLYQRFRTKGMPRKSLRSEVGHIWFGLRPVLRRQPHWRWDMAWHWGLVLGRIEQSLKSRTWYP